MKIFKCFLRNSINLKYEVISVPQGSVRLIKKTQETKILTCYLLITKGVASSSPVPLKIRRVGERCALICRELKRPLVGVLPAPGNRSNERRDREKDLATTGEKKGRNGRSGCRKKPGREK
ncbi:hypothetical protein TNCV_2715941 [Trichonephila clavipes]|nr:hypothetical protein TNCV_2715941 [Trichonephila clavipes]